jgi:hypothetical protein
MLMQGVALFALSLFVTTAALATVPATPATPWPGCQESGPRPNCRTTTGPDSGCKDVYDEEYCIGLCQECCRSNCAFQGGSTEVAQCDDCCDNYNHGTPTGPAHCQGVATTTPDPNPTVD